MSDPAEEAPPDPAIPPGTEEAHDPMLAPPDALPASVVVGHGPRTILTRKVRTMTTSFRDQTALTLTLKRG